MLEYLVDVQAGLRRSFEEGQPMLFSELLSLLSIHNAIRTITLVAYQHLGNVRVGMLIDLLEPI
jgi:hypothetical protein